MNQVIIGKFITKKRRELNLTQEQLGETLGVSHKSVSKWETGKCMPDYSLIEPLCQALGISISELLDGEENENENIRVYDDRQMLNMIERVQQLETQNKMIIGMMLIVMGSASMSISGLDVISNFMSGVVLGVSVAVSLVGAFIVVWSISRRGK